MRKFFYVVFAIFIVAVSLISCSKTQTSTDITGKELITRINDHSAPKIIDVRSPKAFLAGHIPGAINIPFKEFDTKFLNLELSPADEIVVYCESGKNALKAQKHLKEHGFFEVRHLQGDLEKWRKSKYPVE